MPTATLRAVVCHGPRDYRVEGGVCRIRKSGYF